MIRVLMLRSLRDSWLLLASCCALTLVFMCLRVWFVSRVEMEHFINMLSDGLALFQRLLPVAIEDWISSLGRTAFSYEEVPIILLLGLWTVARASECIAGRVENGTIEMLLAQPLRRISLVTSHSVVSLVGVMTLGLATLAGLGGGLAVSNFDPQPGLMALLPAAVNYVGFGVFLLGAATFVSAVVRSRSQAIAIVIALYVVELALTIVARLSPSAAWLENATILTAYEPTLLAVGLHRNPAEHWPLFLQYNAWLYGLGGGLWAAATGIFCHRDLPAPL